MGIKDSKEKIVCLAVSIVIVVIGIVIGIAICHKIVPEEVTTQEITITTSKNIQEVL